MQKFITLRIKNNNLLKSNINTNKMNNTNNSNHKEKDEDTIIS